MNTTTAPQLHTLGEITAELFPADSVRDELRRNLIDRGLDDDAALFPGIVGYEDTVIPQVINAILAKHDIILLGLRGQAKTKLARQLLSLLDEWRPFITGTPLREHPLAPVTPQARAIIEQHGDATPISWLHRSDRYGEKLATPDVSVADLIGDVDVLKASHQKLDLSDESVIHYGIIPRTNHGLFCINELPDLAPRIQVGLLNILEEQDIQIRGFPLRIPLDVFMIFTANPEDYTNRGSIITPLKDRIASQIITHYPKNPDDSLAISRDQAWRERDSNPVIVSELIERVIEQIAFVGRESEYIDQKSGVSARLSIAAHELLISQIERRVLMNKNKSQPRHGRLLDCWQVTPAITGKVELVYEGEQEGAAQVARHLIGKAIQNGFDACYPDPTDDTNETYQTILAWFAAGNNLALNDAMSEEDYLSALTAIPDLEQVARSTDFPITDRDIGPAMELVLEGLHQHSLLSKRGLHDGLRYGDMLRSMLEDSTTH